MTRTGALAVASAVLAASLLWGCAKEKAAPPPIVKKVVPKEKAAVAEKEQPAEAAAKQPPPAAPEMYNPSGRRNPFLPFLKAASKTGGRVTVHGGVPPLQRYDLGEFRFVGVIADRKGYHALVEDVEGKGYLVRRGTHIGRNGGVVSRISDGEIVVREQIQDYAGEKRYKESTMRLQSASAGGRR